MPNKKRLLVLIPTVVLVSIAFLAVAGFFGLEYYATSILKQEIDRNIQDISEYVRVDYDSLGVNWLAFTVDMKKVRLSKPPLPGSITIDKVAVRDFTSIGIKWIPTVIVLDHIVLNNADFKITLQRLATSFSLKRIPSEEAIDQNWKVLWDNLRAGELKLDQVAYSDKETLLHIANLKTDYALSGGNQKNFAIEINNLKFHLANIRLDSQAFSLAASLDQNHVLTHLTKKIKDFSFQLPTDWAGTSPFLGELISLGYDRLAFGVDFTYDYQPNTKELNIMWDSSAKDMGRLQFDLHLTDYLSPPVPVNGSVVSFLDYLEKLRFPAEKASLRGFKAIYQDFGLAPRLIKAEAQAQGQSPEKFTQGLVGSINAALAILPLPAVVKEQVNAVNRFLLHPQEIQLAVTFKKPVPLKNLEGGSVRGFIELLGNTDIKVTSK
jgi:hypothetical protein